jgi:hypothetical protein
MICVSKTTATKVVVVCETAVALLARDRCPIRRKFTCYRLLKNRKLKDDRRKKFDAC